VKTEDMDLVEINTGKSGNEDCVPSMAKNSLSPRLRLTCKILAEKNVESSKLTSDLIEKCYDAGSLSPVI
jgi:hypothetical protein